MGLGSLARPGSETLWQGCGFVAECTGCHWPMHGNDYIYTLPITAARVGVSDVVNNSAAALPASLPYQPLAWSAITMYVDPRARTMATLYGNDAAMQTVQARRAAAAGGTDGQAYQAGAVLALVTWLQRDDPHWFGARIPSSAAIRGIRGGDGWRTDELPALRRHRTRRGLRAERGGTKDRLRDGTRSRALAVAHPAPPVTPGMRLAAGCDSETASGASKDTESRAGSLRPVWLPVRPSVRSSLQPDCHAVAVRCGRR